MSGASDGEAAFQAILTSPAARIHSVIFSKHHPIGTHLFSALLTQIQLERQGQLINRECGQPSTTCCARCSYPSAHSSAGSAVKANTDMLAALSQPRPGVPIAARPTVYKHTFEPAFLETSFEFYKNEAARLLDNSDAKAYLRHVERRLIEEDGRVAAFLAATTEPMLRLILEQRLIHAHLVTIIKMPGSGVFNMLRDHSTDDLRRAYKLISRVKVEGPDLFKQALKHFITMMGDDINKLVEPGGKAATPGASSTASSVQAAHALTWVDEVLKLKTKMDDLHRTCLDEDKPIEA